MAIVLEPAELNLPWGDSKARLALRDGRMFAVLSRLGDLHGELAGQWYVEAVFGTRSGVGVGQIFATLEAFTAGVTLDD